MVVHLRHVQDKNVRILVLFSPATRAMCLQEWQTHPPISQIEFGGTTSLMDTRDFPLDQETVWLLPNDRVF